jgi:hypothetical protein
MANIKYSYPRVDINVKALTHAVPTATESTATTLLVPFACDRGPENVLVPIDTMSDFTSYFGTLDYSLLAQRQILNAGKWLENGGRVEACRITQTAFQSQVKLAGTSSAATGTANASGMAPVATGYYNTYTYKWNLNGKEYGNAIVVIKLMQTYDTKAHYYISMSVTDSLTGTSSTESLFLVNHDTVLSNDKTTTYSNALLTSLKGYSKIVDAVDTTTNGVTTTTVNGLADGIDVAVSSTGIISITVANDTNGVLVLYPFGQTTGKTTVPTIAELLATLTDSTEKAKYASVVTASGSAGGSDGEAKIVVSAKYSGSYYNDLKINILGHGAYYDDTEKKVVLTFDVEVDDAYGMLEKFSAISYDALETSVAANSMYIGSIHLEDSAGTIITQLTQSTLSYVSTWDNKSFEIDFENGTDVNSGDYTTFGYMPYALSAILGKPLETPFDVMLDCGYDEATKLALIKLFCGVQSKLTDVFRNDAFLYISPYVIAGNARSNSSLSTGKDDYISEIEDLTALHPTSNILSGQYCDFFNMAIVGQYEKVTDLYSTVAGADVFVPSTYLLAGLLPYNDATYGQQYPSAGLTRGKVSYESINMLPTNYEKNTLYNKHINYIEKDSRGSYVMSDLTATSANTALANIHNSRSLLKMKKDLTLTAREYLFEFNDTITKQNLTNALNSYISSWIQNRTLQEGYVTVYDSTTDSSLSDKQIGIGLTVKFTDTIEVITVNIVVE